MARIRESAEVYKSRKVQTNPTQSEISIQLTDTQRSDKRFAFNFVPSFLGTKERGKKKGSGGGFFVF